MGLNTEGSNLEGTALGKINFIEKELGEQVKFKEMEGYADSKIKDSSIRIMHAEKVRDDTKVQYKVTSKKLKITRTLCVTSGILNIIFVTFLTIILLYGTDKISTLNTTITSLEEHLDMAYTTGNETEEGLLEDLVVLEQKYI